MYRSRRKYETRCCGGWLLFFTIAFLVLFLLLIFLVPSDDTYEFRHKSNVLSSAKRSRADCSASERFDSELRLCTPKIGALMADDLKDPFIHACQSFYHHSCGSWIRNHTNEDRSFTYVFRKNRKRIREIVTDPSKGSVGAYMFYRSCLDTLVYGKHKVETKMEVKHLMDHILGRLRSHKDLPMVFGRLQKYGLTAPFGMSIENHPTRPEMIPLLFVTPIVHVDPSVLSDMTLQDLAMMEELLEELSMSTSTENEPLSYVDYIKTQFKNDIHNVSSFNSLHSQTVEFWKQYFLELGGANLEHDLILNEHMWIPRSDYLYIENLLQKYESISLEQWRAYVKYSILYNAHNFMPVLPSDSYFRHHDQLHHRERQLSAMGRRALDTVEEKHCITLANQLMPGVVAKEYLRRYMPEAEHTRRRVSELAERIRDEYAELIDKTEWLTPETRQRAQDKISNIIIRAVHPNVWEEEPFQTRIHKQRYAGNLNLIRQYRVQRNLQLWSLYKESQGGNRDAVQRFGAPLTTVNAYYSPVTNTITVFAGIVTAPFYHQDYTDVELHATLGMIIGHELSHGMDNSGRLFDAQGSLTDWWPQRDVDGFLQRAQCIVREYGPPQGCENVDYGTQTLGEDIADITGITLSLNALKKKTQLSQRDVRDFFTIFAQMWAESYDQAHVCNRVDNDVHAVAWFRVDKTLRQLREFRQAFGCTRGSGMWNENACAVYGSV